MSTIQARSSTTIVLVVENGILVLVLEPDVVVLDDGIIVVEVCVVVGQLQSSVARVTAGNGSIGSPRASLASVTVTVKSSGAVPGAAVTSHTATSAGPVYGMKATDPAVSVPASSSLKLVTEPVGSLHATSPPIPSNSTSGTG